MLTRISFLAALALAGGPAVQTVPAQPADAPAPTTAPAPLPGDVAGQRAIAERLAKSAQLALGRPNVGDDNFRQAVALLRAAIRFNPTEPRFARLLVEAQLQLKDTDGAIEALEHYLKTQPRDEVARLQLIDLYLAQMETAERKLDYLTRQLLPSTSLSEPFRSAVAVRAARLYLDRDQITLAGQMLDQALTLSPVNPEACTLQLDRLEAENAPPELRFAALLAMLRANPAQPAVMNRVAAMLADAGLHGEAQRWYARSFELSPRMAQALDPEAFVAAAASGFLAGQAKSAADRLSMLLQSDADNREAQLLRLIAARAVGGEEPAKRALDETTDALVRRLNVLHRELTGQDSPTTQPTGELAQRIPDPLADAQRLQGNAEAAPLAGAYAQALGELAWVTIYFAERPNEADALLGALRMLSADPSSPALVRLEGWQLLRLGKADEARARLEPVAEADPLSRMALIRMQAETDRPAAAQAAQALVDTHAAGLLGAMLVDGLAGLDARPQPSGERASALQAELARFPADWLNILDDRKVSEFYTLTASAGKVVHPFAEPMLVTVTIKNVGSHDLALGAGGTIRPDLWFDCTVKGAGQQQIPGVAFERFGQRLVLRRGETIEHVARVDQGNLWQMMQGNPMASFPLFYTVLTNPVPARNVAAPGPAGDSFTLRMIERRATPMADGRVRDAAFASLSIGDAAEKIRTQELFAQLMGQLGRQQQEPAPEMNEMLGSLRQAIEQGMADTDPLVRAWASYVSAAISEEPRRVQVVRQMAASPTWLQRLLAVTVADIGLPAEDRSKVLETLAQDPEPLVRDLAIATREYIERAPAATQPAGDAGGAAPDGTAPALPR